MRAIDLRVFHGAVFDVPDTDALVVPANKQLDLRWGSHIAETVWKHGGPKIEAEARQDAASRYGSQDGGIALGEAVVTWGGLLPVPWLIHAAILDKYDLNLLFLMRLRQRTSSDTLRKAVTASLAIADEIEARTIACSPMGAGIGAMPIDCCARIIREQVEAYTQSMPLGSLQRVVIASPKAKEIRCIATALAAETIQEPTR